jgi:hypothetical protein
MKKSEFQALRIEIGCCERISTQHPEAYARLIEMFKKHPTAGDDILELHARRNPIWRGIDYYAEYADDVVYTISANECFFKTNSPEAHAIRKMKKAARSTIRDQIEAVRTTTPCTCGSSLNLQVDHVRHFDDLLMTFLNGRVPLVFEYTAGCEAVFMEPLRSEWRDFHQRNAELRMLCQKCNSSRPKWKSSSII